MIGTARICLLPSEIHRHGVGISRRHEKKCLGLRLKDLPQWHWKETLPEYTEGTTIHCGRRGERSFNLPAGGKHVQREVFTMTTDTLEHNGKLTIAVDPIVLKSGTIVTQEEEERYFREWIRLFGLETARNEPYLIGQAGDPYQGKYASGLRTRIRSRCLAWGQISTWDSFLSK